MHAAAAALRDQREALTALALSALLVAVVSLAARLILKDRFIASAQAEPSMVQCFVE
jgi:hypothetical protein